MALERKYQKVFAKNAQSTDLGVVGSKMAGNEQYSTDIETLQSLSNWETGLRAQVSNSNAPYLQDQNSILYVITSQLAYLFQSGIAEWNSQTEYVANRSVVLKNGKIYIATTNNTNVEPEVTENWNTYWKNLSNWGFLGGNIYNQTDLWNILLKGIEYDSSIATAIGGYPKRTRLLYTQEDGTKIYIDSAKDNNTTVPSSSSIFYPTKNTVGTSIITIQEIAQTPSDITITPTASLANNNALVLVMSSNYIYKVELTMGEYKWIPAQNATSIRPSAGRCFFDLDTKEYYGYDDNGNFKTMGELFAWITEQRKDESIKIIEINRNNDTKVWRKVYSNGWIEQGGKTESGASGYRYITFPIEMKDVDYCITLSAGISVASGSTNTTIEDITTTGFTIDSGSPSAYTWKVEGYKK